MPAPGPDALAGVKLPSEILEKGNFDAMAISKKEASDLRMPLSAN